MLRKLVIIAKPARGPFFSRRLDTIIARRLCFSAEVAQLGVPCCFQVWLISFLPPMMRPLDYWARVDRDLVSLYWACPDECLFPIFGDGFFPRSTLVPEKHNAAFWRIMWRLPMPPYTISRISLCRIFPCVALAIARLITFRLYQSWEAGCNSPGFSQVSRTYLSMLPCVLRKIRLLFLPTKL